MSVSVVDCNDCCLGVTGQKGPPGSRGPTGPLGPPGARGERGMTGSKGEMGAPGAPGLALPGPPGAVGRSGSPGTAGAPGMAGPPGNAGAPGLVGPPGPEGCPGFQGAQGKRGETGTQGFQGSTGPQGLVSTAGFFVETADSATGPYTSRDIVNANDVLRFYSSGGVDFTLEQGSVVVKVDPNNILSALGAPVGSPQDPSRPAIYLDTTSESLYFWDPNLGSLNGNTGGSLGSWSQQTSGSVNGGASGSTGGGDNGGTSGATGAQGAQGAVGPPGPPGPTGGDATDGDSGGQSGPNGLENSGGVEIGAGSLTISGPNIMSSIFEGGRYTINGKYIVFSGQILMITTLAVAVSDTYTITLPVDPGIDFSGTYEISGSGVAHDNTFSISNQPVYLYATTGARTASFKYSMAVSGVQTRISFMIQYFAN